MSGQPEKMKKTKCWLTNEVTILKRIIIALLLSIYSLSSVAHIMTAGELVKKHSDPEFYGGVADGYIIGVSDFFVGIDSSGISKQSLCFPDDLTNGMIIDGVINWLNDHPENLKYDAPPEIAKALEQIYSCKK